MLSMPPKKSAPARKRAMSTEHKAALAAGRNEGRSIRQYLDALEQNKPRRGRKRTPDSIGKRLTAIEKETGSASPLRRLQLVQERLDLEKELAHFGAKVDLSALETAFVKTAGGYSRRKGISYTAWRELGVSADVLRRASITRAG
jgi:hypothetical protein